MTKTKKKTQATDALPDDAPSTPAPKAKKVRAAKASKPAADESHYPGKQLFPKHLYGPKGKERIAQNEEDLAKLKKQGFSEEPSDEHLHD